MSRVTVNVIDHDGATQEGPTTPNRRLALTDHISQLGYSVESFPFVWGNEWDDNPICSREKFVKPADINFIHSNNVCAGDLIYELVKVVPASWVIEYSGGGLPAMNFKKSLAKTHCIYPHNIGSDARITNLENFLRAVEEGGKTPCRWFGGYDPILEAKLELLHTCLTPPSDEALLRIVKIIEEIKLGTGEDIENMQIKTSWSAGNGPSETFSGTINEGIHLLARETDCFSPRYIAVLSAIRDYLLKE